MSEELYFNQLVTKSLHPMHGNDRFFEGYLTVEVKDKQGEITVVDELIKVLPVWIDRGAPITDTHSNRVIGKGINYQRTIYKGVNGEEYPAIKIIGKIHSDYELDNEIWKRITSGEYKGLSFGGATKASREPIVMKDGSMAYRLKDLEHYEVAVCKDPAVPLALITDFNPIAKAMTDDYTMHSEGKMLIRCGKFGCMVEKADSDTKLQGTREIGSDPEAQHKESEQVTEKENSQLEMGTKVEMEHTDDKEEAKKIAMDHLKEDPNYYTKLGEAMPKEKKIMKEKADKDDDKEDKKDDDKKDDDKKEHVDLGDHKKYPKWSDKQEALEAQGHSEESAKKIIGAALKSEQKAIDSYKNATIFINTLIKDLTNNMVEKDESKESKSHEEEETEDEDKSKESKVEKANTDFREAIKSNFEAMTEVIQSLAETQKSVSETLKSVDDRLKALETPTDLPLKPATTDSEDIGADVKVPAEPYVSNSEQASLDDDGAGHEKDEGKLTMQEKTFTTSTPRPNAPVETINKSFSQDYNLVLKDARESGDLSQVAKNILIGKYTPDIKSEEWY